MTARRISTAGGRPARLTLLPGASCPPLTGSSAHLPKAGRVVRSEADTMPIPRNADRSPGKRRARCSPSENARNGNRTTYGKHSPCRGRPKGRRPIVLAGGRGNSGVPGGGDHGKHGTFCRLDGADKRRSGRTVGVPWEAGVSPAADGAGCFLGRQGPDPLKRRAGCPPPVSGGGESWPDPSHAGGHVCGGPPACRTPSCRWPAPVRPSPARGN